MTTAPATAPATRVVLVFPPTDGRAYIVTLPKSLASDLRRRYAEMAADHAAFGFKHLSFDEWVEFQLATVAYGDGRPHPAEAR